MACASTLPTSSMALLVQGQHGKLCGQPRLVSSTKPRSVFQKNETYVREKNKRNSLGGIQASLAAEIYLKSELEVVSSLSEIVPDTVVADDFEKFPPTAATLSFSFLLGLTGLADSKFRSSIDSALAYGSCLLEQGKYKKMSCFLDKALVNVGAQLSKQVPGRVSTEVDPRLANDTTAIVSKVQTLIQLYNEVGVSPSRLLFKIPATWQGIEAARQLEKEGIQTHITGVHSFAQATVCGQARVAVIQVSVGRIRDWARTHSGDREVDASLQRGRDPGVDLVVKVGALIKRQGHKTRVMASNLRSKEDVLSLLGVDYLIIPLKVLTALKDSSVDERDSEKYAKKINLDMGDVNLFTNYEMHKWDEAKYEAELGPCARQLLTHDLERAVAQVDRVEEHFSKIWPPPNV